MPVKKAILIAGPTASGKSALALDLAEKTNGAIINADAMQVYSGLPILTAQPDAEEQKKFPHLLYSVVDLSEASSAGKWLTLAQQAIWETLEKGRTPILVGGTGLYFKALLGGLADIPEIPREVRDRTQALYAEAGEEKFREELRKYDPESALCLTKNDRQRLIRAYEVALHTGKPLGEWQKETSNNSILSITKSSLQTEPSPPRRRGSHLIKKQWDARLRGHDISLSLNKENAISTDLIAESFLFMPQRDELYAACDKRFEKMIERGAIEEVKQLLGRKLDPVLPAMKILGVREIASYLNGETTLEEAVSKAQQATRNYAKRQMTWFRNQWPF